MAIRGDKELDKQKRKIAKRMARLTLWKLRDMCRGRPRPRTSRLPKEARVLKSLLAEAEAAGLVPPPEPAPKQQRRSSRRRAQ
jgi:hypothetical protein